jgi:hypothetical protein
VLVTGIGGIRGGDKNYWLYWVDAEMPSIASNLYPLQGEDVVEYKYGFVSWS